MVGVVTFVLFASFSSLCTFVEAAALRSSVTTSWIVDVSFYVKIKSINQSNDLKYGSGCLSSMVQK